MAIVLQINKSKLQHNIHLIKNDTLLRNTQLTIVSKCVASNRLIIKLFQDAGINSFAESRLSNLTSFQKLTPRPSINLIRPSSPSDNLEVLKTCSSSFQVDHSIIKSILQLPSSDHFLYLPFMISGTREGLEESEIESLIESLPVNSKLKQIKINLYFKFDLEIKVIDRQLIYFEKVISKWRNKFAGWPYGVAIGSSRVLESSWWLKKNEHKIINEIFLGEVFFLGTTCSSMGLHYPFALNDLITINCPIIQSRKDNQKIEYIVPIGTSDIDLDSIVCNDSHQTISRMSSDTATITQSRSSFHSTTPNSISFTPNYQAISRLAKNKDCIIKLI